MTQPVPKFSELGLNPALVSALAAKGYLEPTPIQHKAIPGVMSGRDLLGIAQTGTGKTAAFALPILHRLAADRKPAPRKGCRCLVLSPTRELATQIADSFRAYGAGMGFSVITVFGGVSAVPQRKQLDHGVDILVAAPGRLLDHLGERNVSLSNVEIFVLDEADQMLDMGFIIPIRRVVKHLPAKRQNLFFSATMPTDIRKLAGELLVEPLEVSVAPQATTAERVEQQVVFVDSASKRGLLLELFKDPDFKRVLVFTRTKRGADKVARVLLGGGVEAAAIHGNKSQNQRERALSAFKDGETRALVATDIAARGIDISSVSHVVQYDLPEVPESYVHRIGRTARAGREGSAVAFCANDERGLLKDVERVTRQSIPSIDRRGDAALAAVSANAREAEPEKQQPAALEGRSGGGRRRRNRAEGGGGQSNGKPQGQRASAGARTDAGQGQRQARHDAPRDGQREGPREGQRAGGRPERAHGGKPHHNNGPGNGSGKGPAGGNGGGNGGAGHRGKGKLNAARTEGDRSGRTKPPAPANPLASAKGPRSDRQSSLSANDLMRHLSGRPPGAR